MTELDKMVEDLRLKMKYEFIDERVSMFDVFDIFGVPYRGKIEQQISCPFHEDIKPSGRVYSNTDSYYCFSCSTSLTPIWMARRLLETNLEEALNFLINKMGLEFDETKIRTKAKKIADDGTVDASKAYHDIENIILSVYTNGEAMKRFLRLDKLFLGVSSHQTILKNDFKKLANYVLA
jgi:DNA primase